MPSGRTALGLTLASVALLGPGGDVATAAPTAVWPTCAPLPEDCEAWYRTDVTLKWNHPGATATEPGTCVWQTFDADTAGTRATCRAWKGSESTGTTTAEVVIRVDKTPPTLLAPIGERPPDYDGWFNRPVMLAFQGMDATSGVESCSTLTYAGPEGRPAMVGGSCRDFAGNTGSGSFPINYDATPPPPPRVALVPGNRAASLRWSTSGEVALTEVVRSRRGAPPRRIFRGTGRSYRDKGLRNGVSYRYTVTVFDQAGNSSGRTLPVVPTRSRLLRPYRNARVRTAPVLIWKRVRRARYYNVQLFRAGRKILSRWPRTTRLQLRRRWRYQGKRYRLGPGRYRWYVWPGYGARSAKRYGRMLGSSSFYVRR